MLEPGSFGPRPGDATRYDAANRLAALGEQIRTSTTAPWSPGKIWLRDAATIADATGSINRRMFLDGRPPAEQTDTLWDWAALAFHMAAGLRAREIIQDLELIELTRDALADFHADFDRQFEDGHPIRRASGGLKGNPWGVYLASSAATGAEAFREEVTKRLLTALGWKLTAQPLMMLRPDVGVVAHVTPQALAIAQLHRLWDDERRPMKECEQCGRPFPVRDSRMIYCSKRCDRIAYKLRKAGMSDQ